MILRRRKIENRRDFFVWTPTYLKWKVYHFHLVLNLSLSWLTLFVKPFQRIGAHVVARWQSYIMGKLDRGRREFIYIWYKKVISFLLATIKHSKVLPVNVMGEKVVFIRRDWRRKPLKSHLTLWRVHGKKLGILWKAINLNALQMNQAESQILCKISVTRVEGIHCKFKISGNSVTRVKKRRRKIQDSYGK